MEISIKWSMCRTCKSDKGSTLVSIFESDAAKHLNDYAGISIKEDDGLPDQICTVCLERLEGVHQFISDCKSSEDHLRNLVRQTMSSAETFQPKEPVTSGRRRARKQTIEERFIGKLPLKTPIDLDGKCGKSSPTETSPVEEDVSEKFFFPINDKLKIVKSDIEEEYVVSDIVEETSEGNDLETSSQTSTMAITIDSGTYAQDVSDGDATIPKSDPSHEYNIDLGVACMPDRHVCHICSNSYPMASQLNSHLRSHRSEKCFQCEMCGKRFNAACNLTTHIRTHTGEKPYECDFCKRRFADRSTHRKHERMHTNERPYVCSTCGKAFSLSTSLKAHLFSHSSEKPHKCGVCSKGFRLRHQLKAHEKTHGNRQEVDITIAHEEYDILVTS
ncbi:uncharacterized protein Dana_GF16633 [Drosophila ananassae]|uniref:Uncharacterized protein n=1 Tax=Drosophila ananassae TaxID=7217 RepID=B3M0Z0_DROAN|nr:zinc finger protein 235 [Drosophila ananassae]EDV43219.1 uncharacterized protein Dana_GF16633 [Drosophila ananassae]